MNIGLLGLTFGYGENGHPNKGCEALSYSFLEILNNIAFDNKAQYNIFLFIPITGKKVVAYCKDRESLKNNFLPKKGYSNLVLDILPYVQIKKYVHLLNNAKKCDIVFDFTGGDSFTDIYGISRYKIATKLKKSVIKKNIPFVLGSQTIGPFNSEKIRLDAVQVITKSREVYVRDEMSLAYTEKISGRKAKLTTDVAFFLPYEKEEETTQKQKIKVGINPSGLLWCGGYTKKNQFNLTVDYHSYCIKLLEELSKNEEIEIHLIPHCFGADMQSLDNDNVAICELHKSFPNTILAPQFKTAMDAKSYIAKMDVFTGARMHATIAAFSASVPVIPFAYSRKFQGLFESLNYRFTVDGKSKKTEEAVEETLKYIYDRDKLAKEMVEGEELVKSKSEFLKKDLSLLLQSLGERYV